MPEPAILHVCPSCERVFDSPSVCEDGSVTVPRPFTVPSQWMRRNLPPHGTCDWGGCDEEAVAWRWWREGGEWLPVCERHAEETGP